jgi:hypothetical protein
MGNVRKNQSKRRAKRVEVKKERHEAIKARLGVGEGNKWKEKVSSV